jgi:2-keto-4-pentenoate hydratase
MSAETVAARLAGAHAAGIQITTSGALRDAPEAYAVQDLVYARIRPGQRMAAWKAGGPDDRVEPTASPIIRLAPSPARFAGADFHRIGLEAEIAFRLASDLPAGAPDAAIAAAIAEAFVAIEVCDTRLADWQTAGELWKLADFQNNGALVTGSGTAHWRSIDWGAQRAELLVDGEARISVSGAHPYGDPFRLMPWIAAHCARRSMPLRAGDLVTTGSWGGVHYVQPGCEVRARFPGIGEAALTLTAP